MAESFEYAGNVNEALAVFPDLEYTSRNGGSRVWVYNSKEEDYAEVPNGQYIVKIADRYEVHDAEPEKAKHVEPEPEAVAAVEANEPVATPKKKSSKSEDDK